MNKIYTQGEIQELCVRGMERFDELMETFGLSFYMDNRKYTAACPIHGGDNELAINIYYDGDDFCGNWQCHTQQCEEHFLPSLVGFIRGIMSHQQFGWTGPNDRYTPFGEAVEYLVNFLGAQANNLNVERFTEQSRFIKQVKMLQEKKHTITGIRRELVTKSLNIPATYYVERGYSSDVLKEYDVGLCNTIGKPMVNRAVVPVYEDTGKLMVGCTGRSIFEMCPNCKGYHSITVECPESKSLAKKMYPKWKHSSGFKNDEYLYNYWKAKKYIQESGVAILVESPGNCWRLCEAGIKNCVGIFGTSLSVKQKQILDSSGAMSLIIILDNDEAGKKGAKTIQKQCERLYRLYYPTLDVNDIGDMSIDKVTEDIKPFIEQVKELL